MLIDYFQLTKPRITWLILMSTGVGYFFGAVGGWTWSVLIHTLLGTAFIASGTSALNQWWERESDKKMERTQHRPLPSARLHPTRALIFATALSVIGFVELSLGANLLAGLLGLFTLASYLFVYTPLKSRTPHSTTIGAIPGAMPPLIGYAAAHGTLTAQGWALFAILFLWQFPHFYAIAWMYKEDYAKAGIRMLPVVDPSGVSTIRQILYYSLALIPISLLPRFLDMAGNIYMTGALLLGAVYFYSGVQVARELNRNQARRVLLASIVYLPVLYVLMMADHTGL
jgi:heme o synthase